MRELIGYDTETWSSHSISEGLEHYFADPGFEIICAAFSGSADTCVRSAEEGSALPSLRPSNSSAVHVAHNMHFDRSAVRAQYVDARVVWFDSMVAVRAILGASSGKASYMSLDKSTKLLLPKEFHKDEKGASLMPYFSFPSEHNRYGKTPWREMVQKYPQLWSDYLEYCKQDAVATRQLALMAQELLGDEAFDRLVVEAELTYQMNQNGWPVDQHLLQVMADKAQENTEKSLDDLVNEYKPGWSTVKKNGDEQFKPLNLNSGVQLKKWLGERGIVIENAQADTITATIEFVEDNLDSRPDWAEALAVLQAKVDLGGATLKKLQPIAKNLSSDGRLRQMYNHLGASSTHRTTGSGVQMQNLKRLPDDVEDLTEAGIAAMNNNELARNIRQLFKASHPDGQIIVADLKSIEGLLVGWVFGVDWMVEAVRSGKDMYSMSATERFGVPYASVLPEQRRDAKTGVLAGNYGGGVVAYIRASGGRLSEADAKRDVQAYRDTIPSLVQAWWDLHDMLIEALVYGSSALELYNGFSVTATLFEGVGGLEDPSLEVTLHNMGKPVFSRVWHGVRLEPDDRGRDEVTYAVVDERKTAAEPWKRTTSEGHKFKLYGGKLTGTLIQSLARELYFYQLRSLSWVVGSELPIIGQLHDEVVCEWLPGRGYDLDLAERTIEKTMQLVPWYLAGCPVRVKVSHAPRYIK